MFRGIDIMANNKIAKNQFSSEKLDLQEDIERSRLHYEQPVQFYYYQTGGKWNVYSCIYWPEEDSTGTEAQEAKLDIMAEMMGLKPGMHILDVGCGWGGPLTYFCEKYGVTGVGITISPKQRDAAEERAKKHGVEDKIRFELTHWAEFKPDEKFDALYSDEVIVHFHNLDEFFVHCRDLLVDGGMMCHKELHLTHAKYAVFDRLNEHVYQIFGYAGVYRPLWEELKMYDEAGYELVELRTIGLDHYRRTMDFWSSNIFEHRNEIKALVGHEYYTNFRLYLKAMRRVFGTNAMCLDVVAVRKVDPEAHPPLPE